MTEGALLLGLVVVFLVLAFALFFDDDGNGEQ